MELAACSLGAESSPPPSLCPRTRLFQNYRRHRLGESPDNPSQPLSGVLPGSLWGPQAIRLHKHGAPGIARL